jgi:hypothetical protein
MIDSNSLSYKATLAILYTNMSQVTGWLFLPNFTKVNLTLAVSYAWLFISKVRSYVLGFPLIYPLSNSMAEN